VRLEIGARSTAVSSHSEAVLGDLEVAHAPGIVYLSTPLSRRRRVKAQPNERNAPMGKRRAKRSSNSAARKSGLPPGSLVYVGGKADTTAKISLIDYNSDDLEVRSLSSIDEVVHYRDKPTVTWVNVEGLTDIEHLESIRQSFNIHPLVLEDILNTHQRPKFEEYDDYLYIVFKWITPVHETLDLNFEQVSILILKDIIFTFKEKVDDVFDPIRVRIENSRGKIRSLGADYLAYVILDTIVDQFFSLQDFLDEIIETVEEELLENPTQETLGMIQRIKRHLISSRKYISPMRELLSNLLRSESQLIQDSTRVYFRDVFDHVMRVTEGMESNRDLVTGLLDIYISSISNRMNEVMKVLTIFASIFIPLTFVAGIYGMNFEFMPELKWRWSYPIIWVAFIMISVGLMLYFRRKKWL